MTPQPTLTEIRHNGLRHHLSDTDALLPATDTWVADRIHHYAHLAGVDPVEAFTDPGPYAAATGRRVSPNCWGQADWATTRRLVYVDPARCHTRAAAELVTAHEIGHLRWPKARHTCRFFRNVQTLLTAAAAAGTGRPTEQAMGCNAAEPHGSSSRSGLAPDES